MKEPERAEGRDSAQFGGCLCQVLWSMFGPGLVLIGGCLAVVDRRPIGSPADWLLFGAAGASIGARLLDRTASRPGADGSDGVPGPGKYAAWVGGAAALFFVVAHFVAPVVLP